MPCDSVWFSGLTSRRIAALGLTALAALLPGVARAYVEAAYPLGKLLSESTNVVLIRVESVDREKNLIVYRKVRDVKGTHKGDTVKHNIGQRGFHPREWQTIMAWAEAGKAALLFHNNSAGEICIDNYWYQAYAGDWWAMTHAEPYLLRTFAGKPEKLATAVAAMLAGQEVVVPCMVDGDKNALQLRKARLQRMKAGPSILDYNPQRDFVGWGVEEFRAIAGMPGFTHIAPLSNVGPEAIGIAPTDLEGDGRPDLCLFGAHRVVLLQNDGGTLNEAPLALLSGARAADWADYNGDGRPDLLLATPAGPKLYANDGKKLQDISAGLPQQDYYHLTAAAWLDYDGDGRPDILLADGFRGLRLYRNKGEAPAEPAKPKVGKWFYAGPFDNTGGAGFAAMYLPERGVDLAADYVGKNNEKVVWREGKFTDGQINSLALFKPECNQDAVVYVYRELDLGGAAELPVSLGSDDGLAVWLNGQPLLAQNVARGCAPDQARLRLKLQPGKNTLLLKVCQGSGDFAFYFAAELPELAVPLLFEDVSDKVGLGAQGAGGKLKGDHLAVADVDGDRRPDILYSAGTGLLLLNTPNGFAEVPNAGIRYETGRVAPAFGDFDGDGDPDLFVPQRGQSRLFANNGQGHFSDVTAKAGALATPFGHATCAVWADFYNQGRLDLLVGCFGGPNRCFRNQGKGTFVDATEELGLHQRIFNTRALAAPDINKDGVLDVVFVNEGQGSVVLLGSRARLAAFAARDR